MQVEEAKRDAAIRGKKGVSFILAGTVIWIVITAIFLMPNLSLETKNIFMLGIYWNDVSARCWYIDVIES